MESIARRSQTPLPRRRKGIVLELFEANLMEHIKPPCSLREAKPIMSQLANGLSHLRRLNIVHRDVKPENILVKQKHGRLVVALTDLGVAKHMSKTQRSNQTNWNRSVDGTRGQGR